MGGKGRGKGKSKNKENDSGSSSSEDESEEDQERRIDPNLGEAKTFDDLARIYKGRKSGKELKSYWNNECLMLDQGSDTEKKPAIRKKGTTPKSEKEPPSKKNTKAKADTAKAADNGKAKKNSKGETRIDAESGSEVTFHELCEWYAGYSQKDLWAYWDSCLPVESKKKGPKAREKSNRDPYELRVDPTDGSEYTFEELRLYYRYEYDKKTIETYWEETCYVPKKRDRKTESKRGAGSSQKETATAYKKESERSKTAVKSKGRQDTSEKRSREKRGPRPMLYMSKFTNTEEIASSSGKNGWWSADPHVGDAKRKNSILIPSGRAVNSLSEAMHSEDFAPLPMGLRVRAEKLGELLEELDLAGGEGDFPGYAFAFLPGEEDVVDALLDALGIRRNALDEATIDTTSWDNDFTDQQMDANLCEELTEATQMLKDFGQTYELNFSEGINCAPVLYFAQSDCSIDRPVLGVLHTRLWK